MTKLYKISASGKLLILSGFLILVSIFLIIIRPSPQTQTPPDVAIVQNYDGTTTNFEDIKFTGDLPEFPKELPSLLVSLVPSSNQLQEAFIRQFDLKTINQENWENDDYFLTYSPSQGVYSLTSYLSPPTGNPISQTEAIGVAAQTADSLYGVGLYTMVSGSTTYLSGGYQTKEVPPNLADLIQVSFSPSSNGVPLLNGNSPSYTLDIMVNSDLKIQKITATPFLPEYVPQISHPTISINEAVKNINQNQGSIIFSKGSEDPYVQLDSIIEGNFKSVLLEYRTNQDNTQAIPYYRFRGTLINNQNKEMLAEVITPAIEL